MERILSKDEISELLSALREGDIKTEVDQTASTTDKNVTRLDLARSRGAGRWQHNDFDVVLDSFAKNLGISLTNRLQRSVSVKKTIVESAEIDPFLMQLDDHGLIGVVRMDPLKGAGLLILDPALSYSLVEVMLGGSTEISTSPVTRPMTTIEVNVIKGVLSTSCENLQKSFKPIQELFTSLATLEIDPRMVNIAAPDTEVLVAKFTVSIDNLSGLLTFVISYSSMEPLREKLKEGVTDIQDQGTSWSNTIADGLQDMRTEITAQSGEITLNIKDILDLQEGDIIDLNYDPNTPLRILVGQKPKYFAHAGVHNGKKAVRVTCRFSQEDTNGSN